MNTNSPFFYCCRCERDENLVVIEVYQQYFLAYKEDIKKAKAGEKIATILLEKDRHAHIERIITFGELDEKRKQVENIKLARKMK